MKKRIKVQLILFYRDASKNKFFLLLQTNQRRKEFWQNITGGVDEGESLIEAAIRELEEETSITEESIINLTQSKLVFKFHDQWGYDVKEYVFFAELKEKVKVKIDLQEHQDFKWINNIKREDLKFESNFQSLQEAQALD
jgi:dATP pyrophosphohydrolase